MATRSMPLSSAWSCCRKTPTQSLRGLRVNWQRSRLDGKRTEITGSPFWYTTVTSVTEARKQKSDKCNKCKMTYMEMSFHLLSSPWLRNSLVNLRVCSRMWENKSPDMCHNTPTTVLFCQTSHLRLSVSENQYGIILLTFSSQNCRFVDAKYWYFLFPWKGWKDLKVMHWQSNWLCAAPLNAFVPWKQVKKKKEDDMKQWARCQNAFLSLIVFAVILRLLLSLVTYKIISDTLKWSFL